MANHSGHFATLSIYDLSLAQLEAYIHGPHSGLTYEGIRTIHQDAKLKVGMMEDEWRTASEAERQHSGIRHDLRAYRRVERFTRKVLLEVTNG